MKTVRALVSGIVQGVGYRNWCSKTANQMKICGWVRNREDGTVEVVAQGADVEEFLNRLQRGPMFARVSSVVREDCEAEAMSGFEVVR